MKKEEIHLWDWQRILIGNTPWEFMAEVFLRTLIVYVLLLVVLRLLGKRMSAQLTISEMSVMITLGAIISVPMQLPDRGILPAVVVLFCTLLFQRGLNWLAFKYQKVEHITQGDMSILIADGCLQLNKLEKEAASREQVFAALRSKNVQHLGQVKRLYIEASGLFSLYKYDVPKPGLSVLPQQDRELLDNQPRSSDYFSCMNCGNTEQNNTKPHYTCQNCGANHWTPALNLIPANHNAYTLKEAVE